MSQDLPRYATGARPMRKLPLDFEAFHRMYRPIYVHWAEIRLGSRAMRRRPWTRLSRNYSRHGPSS
jgi:hypothetical protein